MVPTHNSTIEAGIGLKALVDEREPGAEIYAAATTREQSRIVFSEAERMRAATPALRRRIVSTTNNLAVIDTATNRLATSSRIMMQRLPNLPSPPVCPWQLHTSVELAQVASVVHVS